MRVSGGIKGDKESIMGVMIGFRDLFMGLDWGSMFGGFEVYVGEGGMGVPQGNDKMQDTYHDKTHAYS